MGEGQPKRAATLGVYPDYFAPICAMDGDRRVMKLARWGLPSLKDPVDPAKINKGTSNVRHPWFDDWKGYLGLEHRCLVPWNRFAEPTKLDGEVSGNAWFALGEEAPVAFFAGLWTPWRGMRRTDEGQMDHEVFAFFTTTPNADVKAIHEKAMPVILTTDEEWDDWRPCALVRGPPPAAATAGRLADRDRQETAQVAARP